MHLKKVKDEVDEPETTIEELVEIILNQDDLEKKVPVRALLSKKEREELIEFIRKNKDVFVWSHRDILTIDWDKAKHCLNNDPTFPLVRKKKTIFPIKK